MENQNKAKAIIENHINSMLEELGTDSPIGWIGDNASAILTEVVFNTMRYGLDVEEYMKSQDIIKI